jgi:ATP-dependent 26S proteasome regulatory subunit
MSILNQIFKFSEIITNQPFSFEVFDKTKKIRKEVSQYFTTANYPLLNDDELFYYCVILSVSLEDNNISNIMVAAELSLKRVDLVQIRFQKHLMTYLEKGYIEKKERHYNSRREHQEFSVSEEIYNCILLDQPLKNKGETKYDIINFTVLAKTLLKSMEGSNITLATAVGQLKGYQDKLNTPVITLLNNYDMDNLDYYLFLICMYDFINDPLDHRVLVRRIVSEICEEDGAAAFRIKREITFGTHFLIKSGLVQLAAEEDFREGASICLTQKVIDLVEQDELITKYQPKIDKNLIEIKTEDVPVLFYNENIQKELDKIINVLQPERFKSIVSEFKKNNMPSHCNILLTGEAGSGKTSMVYKICSSVNALVYPVKVEDMKSMFYGQTQKIVADTFSKFKKLAQANPDRTVVLFLDEADSLINKRYENVGTSTNQTDNAVQSIILQSLEDFNGNCLSIFTSNMVSSFCDDAILRRCLWKLDVGLPTPETSNKIWRHNLKGYSDNLYQKLSLLGLTGGYITNICRKVIMEKMIYQTVATEEMIYQWAMAETALKTGQVANVVGFQKL